jgi:hypothetical protein
LPILERELEMPEIDRLNMLTPNLAGDRLNYLSAKGFM